ncbi:uncharacterized protein LOC122852943 [Aphidius gifuensis]|uniref:uncharacterized protein LOC122852943 n=1 Tax=Aphidius gifuensis TaxID=684658 RepID=UPI001CDBB960|nr:uncharacterized protein LOC122852943 [Aphidius gifuensis]
MNNQNYWNKKSNDLLSLSSSSTSSSSKQESNIGKRKNYKRALIKPHETEEDAAIRRQHDAQRMARFRAKKKKALEESKARDAAKLMEIAMINELKRRNVDFHIKKKIINNNEIYKNDNINFKNDNINFIDDIHNINEEINHVMTMPNVMGPNKYLQLLDAIGELGKNIRLTYAGSKTSIERLKSGITQAKILVKDCLIETEHHLGQ